MTKQARLQQLNQDLTELSKLLQLAQRPKVKDIISKQINHHKTEIHKIQIEIEKEKKKIEEQRLQEENKVKERETVNTEQKPSKKEQPINKNIIYNALTKYSWEDENKKVKIYFSLENVGNQCPANTIDTEFKKDSVQLKIRNYRKQNLIFNIKRTFGEIIPEQSHYFVKTNFVTLTLTKASPGKWSQLNYKEETSKKSEKQDFSDPNASLMNMMKKMYEQGDDNMKKTIGEAWTKSRDKTGKDAFKFD